MFFNNGLLLLLCVLLYVVFAVVLCVIFVIMSFARGWDPLSIAKAAMTVKIIQIPAYIAIFVLGVLLAITLFTMPFVILLLISNVVTLILSGALVITSVVLSVKKYKLDTSDAVLYIVLQFVFCADVVAAAMWCARLKRIAVSEEN